MSESESQIERFVLELRKIRVLNGLPDETFSWLARNMDEAFYEAGQVYGRNGDPVEYLNVILEGEVQYARSGDAPPVSAYAGSVTGLLPFSRLTTLPGTVRAVVPTRILRLHKRLFPELLQQHAELAQRLVGIMSDRIRDFALIENQRDKLTSLGKLSAGLAHELNNPAAAARRAAQSLPEIMNTVRAASIKLMQRAYSEEQRLAVLAFEKAAVESATSRRGAPVDPLEMSDREDRITSWLEAHSISDPWQISATLAEAEVLPEKMDELAGIIGAESIGFAIKRVAAVIAVFAVIQEIDNSTKRITDLVTAIKRYSYMDQAPMQEVDIHDDIENTLKIFGFRLKKGVKVDRQYDPNLPRVCAYGSELNQVWTNLIDNAIDAMNGQGELRIRTFRELDNVIVEISDNGPGIPQAIQSRIFDPFFTTKKVGEGTGLGLDTVARIVRTHHGNVQVKSKPGETTFRIRLPLDQPKPQRAANPSTENEEAAKQ